MKISTYQRTAQLLFIVLIIAAPFLAIFRIDSDAEGLVVFGKERVVGLEQSSYHPLSITS